MELNHQNSEFILKIIYKYLAKQTYTELLLLMNECLLTIISQFSCERELSDKLKWLLRKHKDTLVWFEKESEIKKGSPQQCGAT